MVRTSQLHQGLTTHTLPDSDICGANEDTILHADAEEPSKAVTKSQLRTLVRRTAYTLRHQYGIGKNGPDQDVVLTVCSGHYLLPTLFYSVVAAGGVFSASNPGSTPKELSAQLTQVSVQLLFCSNDTQPAAIEAAKLANLPLSRVLCLDTSPSTTTLRLLSSYNNNLPIPLSSSELPWQRITSATALAMSTVCILFSSGTTGTPKAVQLSHTNMVSQAALVLDTNREFYASHDRDPRTTEYRTVAHLPAAHIAGIQGYFVNPFYVGGTVYWMPRFDFPKYLECVRRHRMTHFFSVPPVFLAIAKSPLVTDQFAYVEQAICGAAPMGKELQAAARKKLGGRGGKGPWGARAHLAQTWGLSETTGSTTFMPLDGWQDETGSVSMLVGSTRARIVDDDGRDVEPGKEGEIWVRGPQVTRGYWEDEKANREAFVDGWFCTGDIAVFRDGLFYIVDRKKVSGTYSDGWKGMVLTCCRNSSNTRATRWRRRSWRRC